jgi:hypothetical protein
MNVTTRWKAQTDTPVDGVSSKIDEVRQSLSKEAEHLAQIAASYGRDAKAHVSDIADDASKQASRIAGAASEKAQTVADDPVGHANTWVSDLLKAAAGLGAALALSGRKTADDVSASAKTTARDLSKLRLTTEPKKTSPDFMPGITLLAGFGAGIALMWFLDPERGRARRNMLRDKLTSWTRQASKTASGTAKDLSNRAQGAMYETRTKMQGQMSSGDDMSETQTWETTSYRDGDGNGSATGIGASDPSISTTDTWGTQPQPSTADTWGQSQPSTSSTEIEIR